MRVQVLVAKLAVGISLVVLKIQRLRQKHALLIIPLERQHDVCRGHRARLLLALDPLRRGVAAGRGLDAGGRCRCRRVGSHAHLGRITATDTTPKVPRRQNRRRRGGLEPVKVNVCRCEGTRAAGRDASVVVVGMRHGLHVKRREHVRVQQRRRKVIVEDLEVRGVEGTGRHQGGGVDPGGWRHGVERR